MYRTIIKLQSVKFFILIFLVFFTLQGFAQSVLPIKQVNAVIGDLSYLKTFKVAPDEEADNTLRIITHLTFVEALLRERDCSELTDELRQRRAQMLNWLKEYIHRAEFPVNEKYADRVPCFIDNYGTICAVGYLVERSAGRAFAEEINSRYQYNYIKDMHDLSIAAWILNSGFTAEEVAMIQPTYTHFKKRNSIFIGPSIGINFSGISEDNFLADHKRRAGARMGVQLEKKWDKGTSIATELLMQQKGYRHEILFTDETGEETGEKAELNFQASYISLPLKAGIHVGRWHGIFLSVGVIPSLLLGSQLESPEIEVAGMPVIPAENIDINDKLNKFDLAAMAEIGYFIRFQEFQLSWNLLSDRSFTKFNNDTYFPDGKAWHKTLSTSLTLKYEFRRNI